MITEHIPDSVKVSASLAAPSLSLFGLPIETWGYIASLIVAVMVIIEKTPIVIQRFKEVRDLVRNKFQ
jgi:hypothetical protein